MPSSRTIHTSSSIYLSIHHRPPQQHTPLAPLAVLPAMSSMEPPPPRASDGDGDGDGAGDAVCCMCGDRGLPHELLRCRFCRIRLQHRYCSDLYPRATAYRTCNWCLREPADARGGANANGHTQAHAHVHVAGNKPTEKRIKVVAPLTETSSLDEEGRQSRQPQQAGCSAMSRAAPELGRPIKKQKTEERPTAVVPPPGAAKTGSGSKKPTQAVGKIARPGRVKVRRYRLLAELIISC